MYQLVFFFFFLAEDGIRAFRVTGVQTCALPICSCPNGSRRRRSTFDVEAKRRQAADLDAEATDPSVWDDPARGQELTTRLARLKAAVERYDSLVRRLDDARAMDELLTHEDDPELSGELAKSLAALEHEVDRLELASLLGGEDDGHDAVASIHAGAGGTESHDWAEILLRMYLRWAEREGFEAELDELLPGEEG